MITEIQSRAASIIPRTAVVLPVPAPPVIILNLFDKAPIIEAFCSSLKFEFFNLLIHPVLEDVTHHSPVLMLLGLVILAALLIPLHHKLEHWAVNKLVEKNKQSRLENAKRTIEELG